MGKGRTVRLLIVGDSAAAGVGASTQDQALLGRTLTYLAPHARVTYRLVARSGATAKYALAMMQKQKSQRFDVALVSLGVNSILASLPVEAWLADYAALVSHLRDEFGVALVVASGLPPMGRFPSLPVPLRWYMGAQARRYDRALSKWAASDTGVDYLPFATQPGDALHRAPLAQIMASDGFHPGPQIYDLWGQRASASILKFVDRRP